MTKEEYFSNPVNIKRAGEVAAQIGLLTKFEWFTVEKFYEKHKGVFADKKSEFKDRLDILKDFGFCVPWGENIGGKLKARYKIILTLDQRKEYLEFQLRELEREMKTRSSIILNDLKKVNEAIANEQEKKSTNESSDNKEKTEDISKGS